MNGVCTKRRHARRHAVHALCASVCAGFLAPTSVAADVAVWLTRGDQVSLLESQPALTFEPGAGTYGTKINLDPATRYQSMEGFGAAVTDSSAWLIQNALNSSQRDALMESLFSPTVGIGINYVRVPMGASDFALTLYTYDDMPSGQTDPTLANFSIAHDLAYIIPTLQQAQTLQPELKVMATPWSPPAWMKNTATLFGSSLDPQYYSSYANYFVRFIQDYSAEGISIDAITVQNEPLKVSAGVPSMSMSTFQQSAFIGDHLGPAFATAGIDTQIFAYDHNWDQWNYPVVVMNDPEAGAYVAGSAFHGYAGDVSSQSNVHGFFPDKDIYLTEISGGLWATDFADNLVWGMRTIIIGGARNWSKTALWWNIALDENQGPHQPGGCTECRGVVTISNGGTVTKDVEYYLLGHASKFVQRGAQRIGSDSIDDVLETVAFENPDGSKILIALNPQNGSLGFDVVVGGEHFAYQLEGKSVATFVWDVFVPGDFDQNGNVNFDDIDDGTQGNGNSLYDYLGQGPPRPGDDLDNTGNSSGIIDEADLRVLVEQLIGSNVGDITRDYLVDDQDFAVFVANLGNAGGYFDGDLDGTLDINVRDFARLQQSYQSPPAAGPNLIQNPGFADINGDSSYGDSWGRWGNTGFGDLWGGNPHASFFAEQPGYFGGVFQMGITGNAGTLYRFELLDVRIEQNADADFRFGLEFYTSGDATKISEVLIPLDLSVSGDGLLFSMSAVAPAGTVFVRPIVRFDNVTSSATTQESIFIFSTGLRIPPSGG